MRLEPGADKRRIVGFVNDIVFDVFGLPVAIGLTHTYKFKYMYTRRSTFG